jgi:hypothetical protein
MPRIGDTLKFGGSGELIGSGTALQLPDITCKGVIFKAQWANTGYVYIGGAGVTARAGATGTTCGFQLVAGESTAFLPCGNLNEFYRICDGTTANCLTYIYWT